MVIEDKKIKKYSYVAGFIGLAIWLLYFLSTLSDYTPQGVEWLIIILYTFLSFVIPYFALKGVYRFILNFDSRKIDFEFVKSSINLELDEFSEKLLENNFTPINKKKFVYKNDERSRISIEVKEKEGGSNYKKRIDFAFHSDPKSNYEKLIKEIKFECQKLSHKWDQDSKMYITKYKTKKNNNIYLWQSEDESAEKDNNKRIVTIAEEEAFFDNNS